MSEKGRNISLSSYDDIFGIGGPDADAEGEVVQEIALEELHPFKDHPFHVKLDEDMKKTV